MVRALTKAKIDVSELKVNMYVCELDRPWLDTPFLFQGFELKTEDDIRTVRKYCKYVYVDSTKSVKQRSTPVSRPSRATTSWKANPPDRLLVFEGELEAASTTHTRTSDLVKSFMDEIRFGRGIDVQLAKEAVSDCVDSVMRNPDALLLLTQLKDRDTYTSEHSMNVCVYVIALGRFLGLSVKELRNLGYCGLLHDMGKMRVPLEILNKTEALTDEERKIMRLHTLYGRDILISARGGFLGAVDAAYSHHEHVDGSGYPRGLTGQHISPYTKMVTIADCYDAIVSDRIYKAGLTHMEALKIMNGERHNCFDADLTLRFIECLGIYPPGSLVEMSNGEVGVVIGLSTKAKLRPRVLLFLDEDKNPREERIVDLSKLDLDANGNSYVISAMLRHDAYGIDFRRILEEKVLHKV